MTCNKTHSRNESPELLDRLSQVGAAATAARRENQTANVNTSSFGPNTRQAKAVFRNAYMKALQEKATTLLEAEGDELAIYEPMASRAHSITVTLKQMESDKILANSVLRAQDFRCAVNRAMRALVTKDADLAKRWQTTSGQQNVIRFLDIAPQHKYMEKQLNALPDRDTNVMMLAASSATAVNTFKEIALQSCFNNIHKAMQLDWANRCKPILFNECEPIDDKDTEEKKKTRPSCLKLRICVCGPNGEKAWIYVNRFRCCLKQTFKRIV